MINYPPDSASSAFGQMAGNVVVFLHLNLKRRLKLLHSLPLEPITHQK
jgi:hypothetical protein